VTGTDPGDTVEVWFEGGGRTSSSFTYEAVSDSDRRTLIMAAEDYSGVSPPQAPGPHYLDKYEQALAENGIEYDVYDVDAHDRTAPDALGVLSHYDAVLWYTGDDVIPRETYQGPGNASRLAVQELYEVREFLNEGGRALYTGQHAGTAHTSGNPQFYDPFENAACAGAVAPRCRPVFGSGDGVNDVLEYW